MKAYLLTTGTAFALITIAHFARMIFESPDFARDPWYLLLTLAAAVFSVWAFRLLRHLPPATR